MPDLDVIVLGAGGAAGARTAAYLAQRAPELGARWAAAGRDPARITRRLRELGAEPTEVIAADVEDTASLDAIASRARVILNAVGPYTPTAHRVIGACVRAGAHYADLTGEIAHVRRIIETTHEAAAAAGVKVVPVCGFEALPPDLAVQLAAERAGSWDAPLVDVELEATVTTPAGRPRVSDWLSHGTRQSILAVCRGEAPGIIAEPGALLADDGRRALVNRMSPIRLRPRRLLVGALAPLPPAFINPAVIHRTAALTAPAGDSFAYSERVVVPNLAVAGGIALALGAIRAGARARPATRRACASVLDALFRLLGRGPADDRLAGWTWTMRVVAMTSSGQTIEVDVAGDGHPGYLSTARIFGEAGLALADGAATPNVAGCLTPAAALGADSAPRFARAGVHFTVQTSSSR